MLTIIFWAALIYVAVKMLLWGIKAAWGIAKIIAFVVLLPALIIGLVIAGMFMLAFGLVVIVAFIVIVRGLILV